MIPEEKEFQAARIEFLKERFSEDFAGLVNRRAIADDLDSLFHAELIELREEIAEQIDAGRVEALRRELDVLHHVDRWTAKDHERVADIRRELLSMMSMRGASLPPAAPREAIPEQQTLTYSLAEIGRRFGR